MSAGNAFGMLEAKPRCPVYVFVEQDPPTPASTSFSRLDDQPLLVCKQQKEGPRVCSWGRTNTAARGNESNR